MRLYILLFFLIPYTLIAQKFIDNLDIGIEIGMNSNELLKNDGYTYFTFFVLTPTASATLGFQKPKSRLRSFVSLHIGSSLYLHKFNQIPIQGFIGKRDGIILSEEFQNYSFSLGGDYLVLSNKKWGFSIDASLYETWIPASIIQKKQFSAVNESVIRVVDGASVNMRYDKMTSTFNNNWFGGKLGLAIQYNLSNKVSLNSNIGIRRAFIPIYSANFKYVLDLPLGGVLETFSYDSALSINFGLRYKLGKPRTKNIK